MKKTTISIICGVGIILTFIIMTIHLGAVAQEHALHPEWSFGAGNAVKLVAMQYGIVIISLTIILIVINVVKQKK